MKVIIYKDVPKQQKAKEQGWSKKQKEAIFWFGKGVGAVASSQLAPVAGGIGIIKALLE